MDVVCGLSGGKSVLDVFSCVLGCRVGVCVGV